MVMMKDRKRDADSCFATQRYHRTQQIKREPNRARMLAHEGSMRASSMTPYRWAVRHGIPRSRCREVDTPSAKKVFDVLLLQLTRVLKSPMLRASSSGSECGEKIVCHIGDVKHERCVCGMALALQI
jgi:hypothetical protein